MDGWSHPRTGSKLGVEARGKRKISFSGYLRREFQRNERVFKGYCEGGRPPCPIFLFTDVSSLRLELTGRNGGIKDGCDVYLVPRVKKCGSLEAMQDIHCPLKQEVI
jgi:hypothetical protein